MIAPRSLVVVQNPAAGRARRRLDAARDAIEAEGLKLLDTVDLEHLDRLRRWTELPEEDRPIIVAAGGDGTVGAVAGALVDTEATMGILPIGTSNDIARSLGIPISIEGAVAALARGHSQAIDIACLDSDGESPRYFLHAAAIGINTAFARFATQKSLRRRLGPFTYLVAGLFALRHARPFHCQIVLDDNTVEMDLLQLSIVNAPVFGGVLGLEIPGSHIADNRLDLLAVEAVPIRRLVLSSFQLLIGRKGPLGGLRIQHVPQAGVKTSSPLDVTLDGEILGMTPCRFVLKSQALRVLCPRP